MSRKPTTKPQAAPAPELSITDRVDRWIDLRAQRTYEPGAFTPVAALRADFEAWHAAEYPEAEVPNDKAFSEALKGGFKIRFEKLPVVVFNQGRKVAVCANLMLREAIRAVAA
jgi:hypothetical protein